jgi:hypothetical protein
MYFRARATSETDKDELLTADFRVKNVRVKAPPGYCVNQRTALTAILRFFTIPIDRREFSTSAASETSLPPRPVQSPPAADSGRRVVQKVPLRRRARNSQDRAALFLAWQPP